MDPLQNEDTDQNCTNENIPIVCTLDAGKMLIQLEGSHTTATKTEAAPKADKKNVKFETENEKEPETEVERKHTKDNEMKQEMLQKDQKSLGEINVIEAICSGPPEGDFYGMDLKQSKTNAAINLSFELKNITEQTMKRDDIALHHLKQAEQVKQAAKFRSISTVTSSSDFKSIACQTQPSDLTSLNDLSLLEISSMTSRSEQTNSLNNYAQAENACISNYSSLLQDEGIAKRAILQPTLTLPADIQEPLRTPSFHVITIEAESAPSLTAFRRPPLCHRIWGVFCDFCAATILCLQVNKDCIFCLGFFAAFVVSASFLTAFFYHTLLMNPTLWQSSENSIF